MILEDGIMQHDNQNSRIEPTIFVSESECFEVVNFRKHARKVTSRKTSHFVFPY